MSEIEDYVRKSIRFAEQAHAELQRTVYVSGLAQSLAALSQTYATLALVTAVRTHGDDPE